MPALALTPVAALSKLYRIDRQSAKILFAGIGVFAAAAIVVAFKLDFVIMLRVGAAVLVLGVLLVAVANLPRIIRTILGTVVVTLLLAFLIAIFLSIMTTPPWPKPTICLVYPLQSCETAGGPADQLAERQAAADGVKPDIPVAIVEPKPPAIPRSNGTSTGSAPSNKVYIQFAGVITRESVVALTTALRNGGWQVQGRSGERIAAAAGLNEVRYGDPADLRAATALAAAVSATGITAAPVSTRPVPAVKSNLELWMSN